MSSVESKASEIEATGTRLRSEMTTMVTRRQSQPGSSQ